ncbi:MAG TPA: hypothetical protein VHB98_08710, partial [Chloroflexota bacterium]|nr:hypothetical protein [Chloroflexota bacterium]
GVQVVHGPAWVRAVARQWTTTGRLSIWAHGQLALAEPSGVLHDSLLQTLQEGAQQGAAGGPPTRTSAPPPQPQAARAA